MSTVAEADLQRREEQVRQAEDLLFSGPVLPSFAKALFLGRFASQLVLPFPELSESQQAEVDQSLNELRIVCDQYLDADQIDRQAEIPSALISQLGEVGLLGMTAPRSVGGKGFSQLAYCRLLEELGSRCSATSIFVNAHHSIGMRGLLLFGTDEQKRRWLPGLVNGTQIAAFALTEVQAGSDAANVQTTATPSADGQSYVLNGSKRYITNGAIADLLTVMARTPVAGENRTEITAFLVTPDTPGFRVVQPRMEKLGIRGTATAKLAFENMSVPRENILGPIGKGLRVALTVLDFGRTTFGACCTGSAKKCLELALQHARQRIQFGQPIAAFELTQDKLARMASDIYAMEAMTSMTAGMIDRGSDDYMLETAMLKVWSTEKLWRIVNDAFQIFGGAAYFTDQPLERMLRDARINQIGEGANEVLTSFIGLVGMRQPGEELKRIADSARTPWRHIGMFSKFVFSEIHRRLACPRVDVSAAELRPFAKQLSKQIQRFALCVQRELIRHQESIIDRQRVQQRIAWAAMELYASIAVISRQDAHLGHDGNRKLDPSARLFLLQSNRRISESLQGLRNNEDQAMQSAFDSLPGKNATTEDASLPGDGLAC